MRKVGKLGPNIGIGNRAKTFVALRLCRVDQTCDRQRNLQCESGCGRNVH
jgi:hypothetical protein